MILLYNARLKFKLEGSDKIRIRLSNTDYILKALSHCRFNSSYGCLNKHSERVKLECSGKVQVGPLKIDLLLTPKRQNKDETQIWSFYDSSPTVCTMQT